MGFSPEHGSAEGAVIYSIARTYSVLIRDLERVYARFGLSAPSFNLLMLLQHGEDPEACTQTAIASRLVVSASDMTGLVDRLEKRGLVKRTPGKDRRSKLLRITPAGEKLLEEMWSHHSDAVKRVTQRLTAQQAERLVQALNTLRETQTV